MSVVLVDTVERMQRLRAESLPLGCRSRPVSVQLPLPALGETLRSLLAPDAARARRESKVFPPDGDPSTTTCVSLRWWLLSFLIWEVEEESVKVVDEEDDRGGGDEVTNLSVFVQTSSCLEPTTVEAEEVDELEGLCSGASAEMTEKDNFLVLLLVPLLTLRPGIGLALVC